MKKLIILMLLQFFYIQDSYGLDRDAIFEGLKQYLFFKKKELSQNEKIEEIDYFISEVSGELNKNNEDVELLFLKGLAHCAFMRAYRAPLSEELKGKKAMHKLSCQEGLSDAVIQNSKIPILSYDQLVVLKAYGGPKIVVYAVDQILATDHYFDDKERVELRRNKIDHLIRLNRYDDALMEIEKLNQDYPSFTSAEWDSAFREQIENAKAKKETEKEALAKSLPNSQGKNKPTTNSKTAVLAPQPMDEPVIKKKSNSQSEAKQPLSELLVGQWWILLVGFVVLGFIGVIIKRRS